MTVKELRQVLWGPMDKLCIIVYYESEEYDITTPSPAQTAFDHYVVRDCVSTDSFTYKISLKQAYMTEDGYEEAGSVNR